MGLVLTRYRSKSLNNVQLQPEASAGVEFLIRCIDFVAMRLSLGGAAALS
jgi:hypothetical protein